MIEVSKGKNEQTAKLARKCQSAENTQGDSLCQKGEAELSSNGHPYSHHLLGAGLSGC